MMAVRGMTYLVIVWAAWLGQELTCQSYDLICWTDLGSGRYAVTAAVGWLMLGLLGHALYRYFSTLTLFGAKLPDSKS